MITQPVLNIKHTNVAYVRLSKGGKRFEIACYRNKVLNWRNKVETDLEEVLQIDNVFRNASKGMRASENELKSCFGTSDVKVVIEEILNKGELQVSEQERQALYEATFRDIASIVVEKSINPETNRPYTYNIIEKAMREIHFAVNVNKGAKQQALDVIRRLKQVMPIIKASLTVRMIISTETSNAASMVDVIYNEIKSLSSSSTSNTGNSSTNSTNSSNGIEIINNTTTFIDMKIESELYRNLEKIAQSFGGRLDVLQMSSGVVQNSTNGGNDDNIMNSVLPPAPPSTDKQDDDDDNDDIEDEIVYSKAERRERERLSILSEAMGSLGMTGISGKEHASYGDITMKLNSGAAKQQRKENKNKAKKERRKGETETEEPSPEINDNASNIHFNSINQSKKKGNMKGKGAARREKEEKKERQARVAQLQQRLYKEREEQEAITQRTIEENEMKNILDLEKDMDTMGATLPPPPNITVTTTVNTSTATGNDTTGNDSGKPMKACTTCGPAACFGATLYRLHFKSEWHRCNLRRKLDGKCIIGTEEEFLHLVKEGKV